MTIHQAVASPAPHLSIQKLDTFSWGVLLIWIGVALQADLDWAIGLLGVGIILLAKQAARKYFDYTLETFWIVVGAVLVAASAADLLGVHMSLVPVVCIGVGISVLLSSLFEKDQS